MRACQQRGRSAASETSLQNQVVDVAPSEPEGSNISCGHGVHREILCVF